MNVCQCGSELTVRSVWNARYQIRFEREGRNLSVSYEDRETAATAAATLNLVLVDFVVMDTLEGGWFAVCGSGHSRILSNEEITETPQEAWERLVRELVESI